MKVLFTSEVRLYFRELEDVLFENDYFGFEDSAIRYVRELIFEISKTFPLHLKKPAPPYFNQFGENMFYAAFHKNKSTTWYVFFNEYNEEEETVLLVRYISNNHMISQFLYAK